MHHLEKSFENLADAARRKRAELEESAGAERAAANERSRREQYSATVGRLRGALGEHLVCSVFDAVGVKMTPNGIDRVVCEFAGCDFIVHIPPLELSASCPSDASGKWHIEPPRFIGTAKWVSTEDLAETLAMLFADGRTFGDAQAALNAENEAREKAAEAKRLEEFTAARKEAEEAGAALLQRLEEHVSQLTAELPKWPVDSAGRPFLFHFYRISWVRAAVAGPDGTPQIVWGRGYSLEPDSDDEGNWTFVGRIPQPGDDHALGKVRPCAAVDVVTLQARSYDELPPALYLAVNVQIADLAIEHIGGQDVPVFREGTNTRKFVGLAPINEVAEALLSARQAAYASLRPLADNAPTWEELAEQGLTLERGEDWLTVKNSAGYFLTAGGDWQQNETRFAIDPAHDSYHRMELEARSAAMSALSMDTGDTGDGQDNDTKSEIAAGR